MEHAARSTAHVLVVDSARAPARARDAAEAREVLGALTAVSRSREKPSPTRLVTADA